MSAAGVGVALAAEDYGDAGDAGRRGAAPGGRRAEGPGEAAGDGWGRGQHDVRVGIAFAVVLGAALRGCVLLLVVGAGSGSVYGCWH